MLSICAVVHGTGTGYIVKKTIVTLGPTPYFKGLVQCSGAWGLRPGISAQYMLKTSNHFKTVWLS